jgi:hypothetical protein
MKTPKIKYYPVKNGDTSLISLSDETKILVDIHITNDSTDDNVEDRFDVKRDLIDNELLKSDNKTYVDAFILTHPDKDHCGGFENHFYQGNPDKYSKADEEAELILVNELWYTPRVFEVFNKELNDDAVVLKKEAKRRMDLYKSNPKEANKDGNRIRIIGYTSNETLKGLEDRIVVPGNSINEINGSLKDDFEMFIHAPFKDTIDKADPNETSIVFLSKFSIGGKNCCNAFFGGDAGWRVWERILEKSDDSNLNWDLFLAPHHCSWGYFNDSSDKEEAKQSSIDILNKKLGNEPKVIASCKKIVNDGDNPPSHLAKNEYVNVVGENCFLVTATDSDTTPPNPIEFEIKTAGPQRKSFSQSSNKTKATLISKAVSVPTTYG